MSAPGGNDTRPAGPTRATPATRPTRPTRATRAVRAGIATDREHGAVVPPLHLSTTYTFEELGVQRKYDYSRSGNPTRDQLGEALAALEGGAGAVCTASGMAAVTTVLQLAGPDDLVVAPKDCYGGTHRLLTTWSRQGRFRLHLGELWTQEGLEEAAALEPRLLWIETPSNPVLRITDIERAVALAREVGSLVVVDNTFLSPALQRPLELGADLVVHSTTKYLNGHSDVVGGAVVALDPGLHEEMTWWANCLGVTGSPFDSFLTLRGVRTLEARMRLHLENARAVVDALVAHPAVSAVHWPGLPDHPGHEVAARQQDGWGAMVSFELHDRAGVQAFVTGLRHFSLAESLGGVESLVAHPATMTHLAMGEEARRRAGIGDALLRLSVGIEDPGDLVADLVAGLDRAREAQPSGVAEPPAASVPSVPSTRVRSKMTTASRGITSPSPALP